MHVKDISNKQIYSLVMDLHKNGYSKSFINKSVQHFRSALKKSEQLCEIETHSSLKNTFSLPTAPPKKERFLNDKEARRLRDYIDTNGEDEVVLLIGFLMYTGARRHEAMNSEWQHINLGDKDWYVPITKSGKPRHIVLNGKAIEIIQRAEKLQLKKHGHIMQWLFVNPQTHKPYRCIFHKWNRIRNELDLQNMRIHDLRHSFASTLVNNGATLYEVQKLLGHSRSATTERYAHLANHRLQRAASLIDKAYS
jgi:integrase